MARRLKTKGLNVPTGPISLNIPHLWSPRTYQRALVRAMPFEKSPESRNRFVIVWHRRAGKDLTCLSLTIREMCTRVGYYVHILPKLNQAKPILWDGKDRMGVPFIDRFPAALIKDKNETELQVILKPLPGQPGYGDPNAQGSIWQVRGADEPDRLRGPNYVGVVFSEYSEMDPYVWSVVQPVLEANGGWAIFNFTPKGRNHSWKQLDMAQKNPGTWFSQVLTINDTKADAPGEDGLAIVKPEQITQMQAEGTPEDQIQQEYYCSFTGFLHGTIFGDLVTAARRDKRVTRVPHNSNLPVGTCWDIGRTDATAIWFYQRVGQEICFIDYLEDSLKGADFYAKAVREKPYNIAKVILPHDASHKGFTTAVTTEQFFKRVFRGVSVAPKMALQNGIDVTRRLFSRCVFDEQKCARGIECLENYRRKWDDDKKDYSGEPIHNEYSHGADAFRTGAQGGMDAPLDFEEHRSNPKGAMTDFSIFGNVGEESMVIQ
jgi:phage terminase large subunit